VERLPLLVFSIFCLTLVVPLWVIGHTAGNWRAALRAWWQAARVLLILAAPAFVIWLATLVS
jgi:hypothetical protein